MIILNGEWIKREEAMVDIEDRGFQFGDGIYEVIRVYNQIPFTMEEHLQRLYESAKKMRMEIPYEPSKLKQLLEDLIHRNQLQTGIIYLQFTRGVSERSHTFPREGTTLSFVAYTKNVPQPLEEMEQGVKVITTEDIRWLRCDIKSLNLLGNIMAKQEAKEAGCYEALQHRGDIVTEGSSSNVFIVKNGTLYTHPENNFILNGITRQKVLQLCRKQAIPLQERTFTVDELFSADEIFLTGTTTEVMSVIQVNGKQIGDGNPGKLTREIRQLFQAEIKQHCFQ